MNRAERRAAGLRRARGVRRTSLDICPEDLAAKLPGVKDGDVVSISGLTRDRKTGVIRVQPGAAHEFIVKVRE